MTDQGTHDGVFSFLDTDLYKLTMQCAVLKYFPTVEVEYTFINRTPQMRLSRDAYFWLQLQVENLGNISLTEEELAYLQRQCPYLSDDYLLYLQSFRLRPSEQVKLGFTPVDDGDYGDLHMNVKGLWLETIMYEVPLLALTSEAYFRFCDKDWSHEGQEEKAYQKGMTLFRAGCLVSEFGSRRRRDFKTQDMVVGGLCRASKEAGMSGTLTGTSNVYFAMKHGIPPIGTVAHEWYMGIAALTNDYEHANELGLSYWLGCFGGGVLGIALTDTFGTATFFEAFKKPILAATSLPSVAGHSSGLLATKALTEAPLEQTRAPEQSYAEVFAGIRQDSGDPKQYIKQARNFYDSVGIKSGKNIVFSDSLNTEKCIEYKKIAEDQGFVPSFGVGTFFTNDFTNSKGEKSVPLNIVIKLSSADGRPAIKISDNIGKNTGDPATVDDVKQRLGYVERGWKDSDEAHRWDIGR